MLLYGSVFLSKQTLSDVLFLTARPTAQLISNDELIIYNDSVSVNLSCRIIGNPLPEVAWFKDNQVINSSTNFSISSETVNDVTVVSTMTILDVSQRNFGQYYCHGSNKLDGYGSQVATVIDYSMSHISFIIFHLYSYYY